jgi:hypothetical protein
MSEVTQACLQDLVSQGFMMVAKLSTYHMLKDPASPAPAEGYMVTFAAFYGWGFSVSSHRFLYSLLQYYGLEVHHLTPSGILHIMTFVTLCEAYMRIEPYFDLRNHFFCVRLSQGLSTKVAVLGGVDIYVKFGHGVDPYIHLPMSNSSDGW